MMKFSFVDDVGVVTHGSQPPSEAEWSAWLEGFREHHTRLRWLIIYSLGGGPDGPQRSALTDLLDGMKETPETLMFTDSIVVRGVVTAVSWYLPADRRPTSHPLRDLRTTLRDRGLPDDLRLAIEARIKSDLATLRVPSPGSS